MTVNENEILGALVYLEAELKKCKETIQCTCRDYIDHSYVTYIEGSWFIVEFENNNPLGQRVYSDDYYCVEKSNGSVIVKVNSFENEVRFLRSNKIKNVIDYLKTLIENGTT